MKPVRSVILATLLASSAFPVLAQMVAPVRSGYVHYVEGSVFIDDAAVAEPITGHFPEIGEGSVIRTERGRAEVLMNPGVTFRLGEDSSAQMVITAFADTRVELLKGSSTVQIIERLKDTNFSLTVGEAQIVFDKAGFMHVDTQPARIVVYTGQANVRLGGKVFEVTGGKTLDFANGASATVQKFDKDQTEALDRWSMRRGEVLAQANASAARNCFIGQNCGPGWNWNSRFGMMVYIPVGESLCDPFLGYCFYNPLGIRQARTIMSPPPAWAPMPTASTGGVAPTSTGYSGAGAAAHSTAAAPAASSSASGSSAGTVGQGTAAGNRGR